MAGLAKQLAGLGTPGEISPAYEGELGKYKAFYIPCVFPAMSLDLILVVQDGAVAGLQTGAYTGGQKETAESAAFSSMELALPAPGKTEWSVLEGVGMADGRVQIRLTPDQIRLLSYRVFLAVIL